MEAKRDKSSRVTVSVIMHRSALQRFTLSARGDVLDVVQAALWPAQVPRAAQKQSSI